MVFDKDVSIILMTKITEKRIKFKYYFIVITVYPPPKTTDEYKF